MTNKDIRRLEQLESKNTKYCITCHKIKPLLEFGFSAKDRKFVQSSCSKCRSEREKEGREEKRIMNTYGISLKSYDKMLKEQGGGCKICGTKIPNCKGRFCVDHDHKTGKIRGLLCTKCNTGLGMFVDNPKILAAAITYLLKTKGIN